MTLSLQLLMHICQDVSLSMHLNADDLRFPFLRLEVPNLTWSMDFVKDALAHGHTVKCNTCVDDVHEGVRDDYRRIWHVRCAGHTYSGRYRAVLWSPGYDKSRSGKCINLPCTCSKSL